MRKMMLKFLILSTIILSCKTKTDIIPISPINVCPQPFFTMQINPDGKVVPCYSFEYPGIMGDCNTQSMKDIWDSSIFTNFRKRMLNGRQEVSSACRKCNIMRYRVSPEDVLDNDVEKIRERYKEEK